MRYRGGFISATLPTVNTASASGAWTLAQQMQYQAAQAWPSQPLAGWTAINTPGSVAPASAASAITDTSGNVYYFWGAGTNRSIIMKFDPNGTKLWERKYFTDSNYDEGTGQIVSSAFDNAGNLWVLYSLYQAYFTNMGVMKINPSNGDLLGSRQYAYQSSTNVNPYSLVIDGSNNVYISGNTFISNLYYTIVSKINPSTLAVTWTTGISDYTSSYTGSFGAVNNIALSPDGSTIYVGTYRSTVNTATITTLTNTGSNSGSYNISISGASTMFTANGLTTDTEGNIYVTGSCNLGIFLTKLNSSFAVQWTVISSTTNNVTSGAKVSIGSGGLYFSSTYNNNTGRFFSLVSTSGTVLSSNNYSLESNAIAPAVSGAPAVYFGVAQYGSQCGLFKFAPNSGSHGMYLYGTSPIASYFAYSGGPSFTTATATVASYSPTAVGGISSTVHNFTVTLESNNTTFTTTSYNFPSATGSALYWVPGTYSWIAPTGVTSVSVVAVGGGGGGGSGNTGNGGGGGALGYINNLAVTPGTAYTVVVGAGGAGGVYSGGRQPGGNGGESSFRNSSTLRVLGGSGGSTSSAGAGGTVAVGTGGSGGSGGGGNTGGGGGGGAGGYSGSGGTGGSWTGAGSAGGGGAGGGGGSGYYANFTYGCGQVEENYYSGGSGGNVGILGSGANGAGGTATAGAGGTGSPNGATYTFGSGGYGGGYSIVFFPCCGGDIATFGGGGNGAGGAVRIVWGTGRSFPTTSVGVP